MMLFSPMMIGPASAIILAFGCIIVLAPVIDLRCFELHRINDFCNSNSKVHVNTKSMRHTEQEISCQRVY